MIVTLASAALRYPIRPASRINGLPSLARSLLKFGVIKMLVLTLIALSADALAGGSGSASLPIGVTVNQSICTPQQQTTHPRACARTAQTTTVETARIVKPNASGSAFPYTISVDPQQNVVVKTIYI